MCLYRKHYVPLAPELARAIKRVPAREFARVHDNLKKKILSFLCMCFSDSQRMASETWE